MRITNETAKLVADLEEYIGDKFYNGSSYNGWTGERGCHFRYPVNYKADDGTMRKTKWSKMNMDLSAIREMHYKAGSNEIYIGSGLVEVLNELERRFGLDFEALLKDDEN